MSGSPLEARRDFFSGARSNGPSDSHITTLVQAPSVASLIVINGSNLYKQAFTLDAATINNMNDTVAAVDVVAAPGAGLIIVPLLVVIFTTRAGGAWTASPTHHLYYAGSATDLTGTISSGLGSANGQQSGSAVATGLSFNAGVFDPRNKSVQAKFTGTIAPGGRGGNASANGQLFYTIVQQP